MWGIQFETFGVNLITVYILYVHNLYWDCSVHIHIPNLLVLLVMFIQCVLQEIKKFKLVRIFKKAYVTPNYSFVINDPY